MAANNPINRNLYEQGIPKLKFEKLSLESTKHTSGHAPIDLELQKPFAILDTYQSTQVPPGANSNSTFLTKVFGKGQVIYFSSEADVQAWVMMLFDDLIDLMNRSLEINVTSESFITNESGTTDKPDLWILWCFGRPICVVEVKSPLSGGCEKIHILDNEQVVGQAYDYALALKSFHGQEDCFVILTTLKDWKVLWLPEADYSAASTSLSDSLERPTFAPSTSMPSMLREIHSTRKISHNDPSLPRVLLSVIEKCLASRFCAVPVLATSRVYIQLTGLRWKWWQMTDTAVESSTSRISFALKSDSASSAEFTILKSLHNRADCKVWAAMASASSTVCVIKQTASNEDAVFEADVWRAANACPHASHAVVLNKSAVVMPFVFQAVDHDNVVMFRFDFHISCIWGFRGASNSTVGPLPPNLAVQTESIRKLVMAKDLMDVRKAARQASERLASCGIQHNDLEWRHVAIMPVFNDAGTIVVDVLPVLIDFDRCRTVNNVSTATARARMVERIDTMSSGKRFE